MKKEKKIIIYSTPTCIWCRKAKDLLNQNKIRFKDADVSRDHKAAHEMIEKSGQQGVPVIDIDGEVIVGYDEERIKERLHRK